MATTHLTCREPREGGKPERLGPTEGSTLPLRARRCGTCVHGRQLVREHLAVHGQ
jgi:hypothetical protein